MLHAMEKALASDWPLSIRWQGPTAEPSNSNKPPKPSRLDCVSLNQGKPERTMACCSRATFRKERRLRFRNQVFFGWVRSIRLCRVHLTRWVDLEVALSSAAQNLRLLPNIQCGGLYVRIEGAKLPRENAHFTSGLALPSGNNCRSPAMLTLAQSQGTKMASTVARGRKTEENQRRFC